MNNLAWMRKLPATPSTGKSLTLLEPKTLKDVLDNIIIFERPSTDKVIDSEDIFNDYETYRKNLKNVEAYNTSVFWNLEVLKSMFYLTKSLILNKCLTIECPFTSKTITTSKYFLTTLDNLDLKCPDVICNYYFRTENIIIGFSMGGGWNGHNAFPLYLLSLTGGKIEVIEIEDSRLYKHTLNLNYYIALQNISRTHDDTDEVAIPTVTTLHGSMSNLGHTLFNELTGLFLLDHNKLINRIDEVMMGPYDPYLISKYFERNNIKISNF
jgi:hypothetical protein